MPVTQKEIAQNLGVSRELVKSALSGKGRIAPQSRERILKEAERLGYHSGSNQGARALISSRYGKRIPTEIIAVLSAVPEFEGLAMMRVPYNIPFIGGIAQAASERDMDIHFCTASKARLPRLVMNQGVDGVICLNNFPGDLPQAALPIINSNGMGTGWTGELEPAHREGAALAIQHLLDLGHKRIACLMLHSNGGRYFAAAERLEGYREALAKFGINTDENLIINNIYSPTVKAGAAATKELLSRGAPFTAIFCFNDLIAMGAIETLREQGLQVPQDVSIVGFDDVSLHYDFETKLTSVGFDRFAMGCRAVELICNERENIHTAQTVRYYEPFPVNLAVRDSTGPVREHRTRVTLC